MRWETVEPRQTPNTRTRFNRKERTDSREKAQEAQMRKLNREPLSAASGRNQSE